MEEDSQELERGYYFALDALSREPGILRDREHIDQIICEAIEKIGMHLIDGPHSVWYADCAEKDIGVSSVAILAESSISIHTYPMTSYLACDIFSCKPFDDLALIEFFKERLHISHYQVNRLMRGSQIIQREDLCSSGVY